jgi:hypothetical protein
MLLVYRLLVAYSGSMLPVIIISGEVVVVGRGVLQVDTHAANRIFPSSECNTHLGEEEESASHRRARG